jgi:predicted permease
MEWLLGLETIVGMAFLRVVVPVVITLLLGYLLKHLNAKWQAEARSIVTR